MVRILVADDNAAVRHYLRSLLELQNSWRVCDEARTGSEALERVKENPPDVILLDSSGQLWTHKLPSTPPDFEQAVLQAIAHLLLKAEELSRSAKVFS